jgi:hypothetical protein
MLSRTRPDWSRRLPQPLTIPDVMELDTLADVRELLGHLADRCRGKHTWQTVEALLFEAARGADPKHVATALRIVLFLGRVTCHAR